MQLTFLFLEAGCDFAWVGDDSTRSFRRVFAFGLRSLFLSADMTAGEVGEP